MNTVRIIEDSYCRHSPEVYVDVDDNGCFYIKQSADCIVMHRAKLQELIEALMDVQRMGDA